MPEHPDTLAKFCPTRTAEQILSSQCLRWSAPNLMSDPFELTHQTPLSFNPLELLEGVIRSATGMIFSREPPRSNAPLAAVVRRWRDEERFASQEEAEEVLEELMSRMVDQRLAAIEDTMAAWRKFTRELRICSFSARPDNLSCWQHFADRHRGLVLRFRCAEHTALPEPKAVVYSPNRPEITHFKEQVNAILYQEKIDASSHFLDKFLVKPSITADEQEWRCFVHASDQPSAREPDDTLWYDDRPFDKSDLSSVYFGAFMPVADKQRVIALLTERYPETKLFQAAPIPGKYEVAFNRLRINE